jgi:hypothetical protein
MKKKETILITEVPSENVMEIHVYGEYLSNKVFLHILDAMNANRESDSPKSIHFVVYTSMMHTAVRYAIPSELYEKIDIRSLAAEEGGLKDASGM